jgi:regulator of protease activity HflC (stomatin/prohibitin superfamily)
VNGRDPPRRAAVAPGLKGGLMGYVLLGIVVVILIVVLVALIMGIRIIRPTHRGLVERLGKYNRYCEPGLHINIPVIERLYQVDVR